jgi:predicted Zn-dependent peptidase
MPEFYKKVLENNVTVLFEKRQIPVVSLSISVNNGGEFEHAEEKGISHFIEHFVFKGTKKRTSEELAKEIEKKGGVLNASTSEEMTSFFAKLPARHFKQGFDILSDVFLNPAFSKGTFEKERKVILEEIRMFNDNPMLHVADKIKSLLYEKPFSLSIAGDFGTVKGINREQLIQKYRTCFKHRVIVSAVGKGDFNEICNFASKFPKCNRESIAQEVIKLNKEEIEKRKGINQAHFVFGFHSPRIFEQKRYLNGLVMMHLAGGMSSILNREIREKRGLAYVVHPEIEAERNYGYSTIYVGTEKKNLKKVRELILRGFKNLGKIKKADFEQTKEQMIGLKQIGEEDSLNVMNSLALEELGDNAEEYYQLEEKIKRLKLEDVKNFKLKGFSSFSLVPE